MSRGNQKFSGIESLEVRLFLSTYYWDGLGDGVSITDRANWHNNHVPGPDDTAIIESASPLSVRLDSGVFEVNRLVLSQKLTVTGGALSVFSASDISGELDLAGGQINGGGDLNISGTMDWTAGQIAGAGDIVVAPGGTLHIAGQGTMDLQRDVINHGMTRWSSGNLLGSGSSGTVINNAADGVFKTLGAVSLKSGFWPGAFINQGVFVQDSDSAALFRVPFSNSGTLNVARGVLELWAGGANSGPRNIAQGATLHYFGDFTEAVGSTLAGGGDTIWQGGTHTIIGPWTMSSYLYLSNATISGPGDWTIDGVVGWSHGSLQGTGNTIIGPAGKIEIRTLGEHALARNIQNNGTIVWNRGPLTMNGATITNPAGGAFYVATDATAINGAGMNRIVNHGEIRKVLPTDAGFGGVTLDSDGLVYVRNGSLTLAQGSVAQLDAGTLSAGSWRVFGSGILSFSGAAIRTVGIAATVERIGLNAGFDALSALTRNEGVVRVSGGGFLDVSPVGGTFVNAGTLSMGNMTALRIGGDFVQEDTGVLNIGLAAPMVLTSGRVLVADHAVLGGSVSVTLELGYTPSAGDEFLFLGATSAEGHFSGVSLAVSLTTEFEYLPDGVLLRFV